MKPDQRIERPAAVLVLLVLVGDSLLVWAPFTTAVLWWRDSEPQLDGGGE